MKFAINSENKRSQARSGERGICEICEKEVIGHHGEFRQHWQHTNLKDCDPWSSFETKWHKDWKAHFPEVYQELVIENEYGERHRADIKNQKGLVIEFQNSPLSFEEIKIREAFYKNLIWVINAEEFKSNFQLRSVVKSKLRRVEEKYDYEIQKEKNLFLEKISKVENSIEAIERKNEFKLNSIRKREEQKKIFGSYLSNFESCSNNIIQKWKSNEFFSDFAIDFKLENTFKPTLSKLIKDISELEIEILNNRAKIDSLDELDDYQKYKVVDYTDLSEKMYSEVRIIQKANKDSLFPKEPRPIHSRIEFLSLKRKKDSYIFLIDVKDRIKNLQKEIDEKEKLIDEINKSLKSFIEQFKVELNKYFQNRIQILNKEVFELNEEWGDLIVKLSDLKNQKEVYSLYKDEDLRKIDKKLSQEKDADRGIIMSKNKGLYTYIWKNERKRWSAAKCPLFFDFGDGILFEKIKDGYLEKISHEDFLNRYNKTVN